MSDSQPRIDKPSIECDADFLHQADASGYLTNREIERWAELQIAAIDQPSIELIELATIRETDPFQVLHWLNTLRGDKPRDVKVGTQIGLIALCFLDEKHSIRASINALLNLNYAESTSDAQRKEIYLLDHECDYASNSLDTVADRLRAFLTPYADELRQQYAHLLALHQR